MNHKESVALARTFLNFQHSGAIKVARDAGLYKEEDKGREHMAFLLDLFSRARKEGKEYVLRDCATAYQEKKNEYAD